MVCRGKKGRGKDYGTTTRGGERTLRTTVAVKVGSLFALVWYQSLFRCYFNNFRISSPRKCIADVQTLLPLLLRVWFTVVFISVSSPKSTGFSMLSGANDDPD